MAGSRGWSVRESERSKRPQKRAHRTRGRKTVSPDVESMGQLGTKSGARGARGKGRPARGKGLPPAARDMILFRSTS